MRKNLEAENRDNVMKYSCIKAITGVYGTISINLCEMLGYCECDTDRGEGNLRDR